MYKIKQQGFTLIELVVFIVIIGIISTGIAISYRAVLQNNVQSGELSSSGHLAIKRMEIIIGQRRLKGFNASVPTSYDICQTAIPVPAVCATSLTGYTTTSTITVDAGDSNYQDVVVNITGNSSAVLRTRFANYG